jgi:hypothetical protein
MVVTAEEMAERHARGLARLQEIALRACEGLQERLREAETAEAAATLALSLQRMARACRQAMLVESKLAREARTLAREDAAGAEKARVEARRRRMFRARLEAAHMVAEACETTEEAESLMDDAGELLEGLLDDPAYAGEDLGPLIEALREELGLNPDDEPPEAPEVAENEDASPASPREPESQAAPVITPAAAAEPPPRGPRLIQGPDFGWYPAPDSS